MKLFKNEQKETKLNFNNIFDTHSSSKRNFISNFKTALLSNKFIKYISIGGLGAAIIDTFLRTNALSIVEWTGQIAIGYALSNAIQGNQPIQYKNNEDLTKHMVLSAGLIGGGLVLGAVASYLPLSHLLYFFTTSIVFGGIGGLFQAGIEKYQRKSS